MPPFVFIILFLFLAELPLNFARECNEDCKPLSSSSGRGGGFCACNPKAPVPGCLLSPCRDGDRSDDGYTCICNEESAPDNCVNSPCRIPIDLNCTSLCTCAEEPQDCYKESKPPIDGNPPCGCTEEFWPTGCTIRKCTSNERDNSKYFCYCTKNFFPSFCYGSPCSQYD